MNYSINKVSPKSFEIIGVRDDYDGYEGNSDVIFYTNNESLANIAIGLLKGMEDEIREIKKKSHGIQNLHSVMRGFMFGQIYDNVSCFLKDLMNYIPDAVTFDYNKEIDVIDFDKDISIEDLEQDKNQQMS